MLKDDRSPVTVADLAAQAVITARLHAADPTIPLMAEEDASQLRDPAVDDLKHRVVELVQSALPQLAADAVLEHLDSGDHPGGREGAFWVLDPIDGTKGFLRGDQFAIALALVVDGRVELGVLGCPNLPVRPGARNGPRGVLLTAVRGGGATGRRLDGGNVEPVSVSDVVDPAEGSFCESVEAAHSSHGATARVATHLGLTAPPYRIDGQNKYAVVARGEASIYLRLPTKPGYREKIWDHAAGEIIVSEAGGRVTDGRGQPLDFGLGRTFGDTGGIVVTNGTIHDAVLEAVRQTVTPV